VIQTFLRRPTSAGEFVADGVRLLGTLSVIAAAIGWGPVAFGVCAFALVGVYAPRFLGLRPAFDVALGVTVLVAAWSSVLDVYPRVAGYDLVVHFAANGLIAAAASVLLERVGAVAAGASRVQVAVLTTTTGMSAAVVWEVAEWLGHNFIDPSIYVAYDDTIGDLVAGTLGSFIAGLTMRLLAADSRSVPAPGSHAAREAGPRPL
jgi:hypothetical protein